MGLVVISGVKWVWLVYACTSVGKLKKVGFLQYESKINASFKKKFCLPTETVDFWNVFEYEQLCNMSLNQLETEKINKNKQNIFIMFILD